MISRSGLISSRRLPKVVKDCNSRKCLNMEIDVHQPSLLPPPSPSPECQFPKWLPIIIIIIIVIKIIKSHQKYKWLPDRAQVWSRSSGPSQPPTGCQGISGSTTPDLWMIFMEIELNLQKNLESTSPQDTRWCTRVPRHRGVSSTTWLCWCGCSATRSAWHLSKPGESFEWKYPVFQCLTWTAWSRSSNEVIPTNSGFADRRSAFTRVLS